MQKTLALCTKYTRMLIRRSSIVFYKHGKITNQNNKSISPCFLYTTVHVKLLILMSLGKQTVWITTCSHVHLAILLMDISTAVPKISVSCVYRLYFFITTFWICQDLYIFPWLNRNACITAIVYAGETVRFDNFTLRCFLCCSIDIR